MVSGIVFLVLCLEFPCLVCRTGAGFWVLILCPGTSCISSRSCACVCARMCSSGSRHLWVKLIFLLLSKMMPLPSFLDGVPLGICSHNRDGCDRGDHAAPAPPPPATPAPSPQARWSGLGGVPRLDCWGRVPASSFLAVWPREGD